MVKDFLELSRRIPLLVRLCWVCGALALIAVSITGSFGTFSGRFLLVLAVALLLPQGVWLAKDWRTLTED